jgi:general secretion pathway protein H
MPAAPLSLVPGPGRSRAAEGRRRGGEASERGFTLIELLVVVALVSMLMGSVIMGLGSLTNAKLKSSTTLIASALRTAFTRSASTAQPTRLVFDFTESRLWVEEGSGPMLVNDQDLSNTGGADPATEAEKKAAEEAARLLKGPKAPRTSFRAIKGQTGFEDEGGGKPGRGLGGTIRFREIHVQHQIAAAREGRSYLYVWPGGQTELAYIQVAKGQTPSNEDTMTVFVHPLTGKVRIVNGAKTLPMPGTPEEGSEREDRGGGF